MGKKIAIIQSNYIPWKGYFNIMKCVDEFILLDDVQYTRRDWRNRNLIKTDRGLKWLTIPVAVKGRYDIPIQEVETAGTEWRLSHWNEVQRAYEEAPFFSFFGPELRNIYLGNSQTNLSMINHGFMLRINEFLGIRTPIRWSREFGSASGKSERLLHICKSTGADEYLSGSAAESYLDVALFNDNGIKVTWTNYSGFPTYNQLHGPFEHGVSVIDLIFNHGPDAYLYLKDKIWE